MITFNTYSKHLAVTVAAASLLAASTLHADAVTDWNDISITLVSEAIAGPPPANRAIALVQTSVYEAVNAITQQYSPSKIAIEANSNASTDAAVAAASSTILGKLLP